MEEGIAEVILFPVKDVQVERDTRQRTELDADVKQLAQSIETSGLLNPIIIHADGRLVAGERRLEAHKLLKKTVIEARIFERLTPMKAFLIELQENLQRRELRWQDEAAAVLKYHEMRMLVHNNAWTQLGTANDIGISSSAAQRYIAVGQRLQDPEVAGCQTLVGAFNLLRGRAERAQAAAQNRGIDLVSALPSIIPASASKEDKTAALGRLLAGGLDEALASAPSAEDSEFAVLEAGRIAEESLRISRQKEQDIGDSPIITADFLEWAAKYKGDPFDVLHLDFPYGKNYTGSNTRRTGRAHIAPAYDDSPEVFWQLLRGFFSFQEKLAYPISHCLFWFDMQFYSAIIESFEANGWRTVQPYPLIWAKPYQGVASDTRRRPRHVYETALLFSRGDRKLVRIDQDYFEARVDEKLHINQKSIKMLRHFLSLIVDEHTALLDPTCGSGSALAAAKSLGAARILGLELDESNAEVARFVLARGEAPEAEAAE